MDIFSLVETASKTLAPTKSEMEALLHQWLALHQHDTNPDFRDALSEAINILDKSASVPALLSMLRDQQKSELE